MLLLQRQLQMCWETHFNAVPCLCLLTLLTCIMMAEFSCTWWLSICDPPSHSLVVQTGFKQPKYCLIWQNSLEGKEAALLNILLGFLSVGDINGNALQSEAEATCIYVKALCFITPKSTCDAIPSIVLKSCLKCLISDTFRCVYSFIHLFIFGCRFYLRL